MKAVNAPLALETSGHVFIADHYYGYDDGIYTALRMIELLSRKGTAPLAEIMACHPTTCIPRRSTVRHVADEQKATIIDAVGAHFADYEINAVDGVRVTLPEGWFIIRASNTEPKLSLRFEANSDAFLGDLVDEVETLLKEHGIEL